MPRQDKDAEREVAKRILKLRKHRERKADFARRLGITPQLLRHYEQGGGAGVEALAKMGERGHDVRALLTGRDPDARADIVADAILREVEGKVQELRTRYGLVSSEAIEDLQLGEHAEETRDVLDSPEHGGENGGKPPKRKRRRQGREPDTDDPSAG